MAELSPDAYQDTPWTVLFPWLAHHTPGSTPELDSLTPAPDWWLTESPAVSVTAAPADKLCRGVARTIIGNYPDTVLGIAIPTLPARLPLAALGTGARAGTTFQRLNAGTVGDLASLTVQDLFAVRSTGLGTVEEIVAALTAAAIARQPTSSGPGTDTGEDAATAVDTAAGHGVPPAQRELLDDLREIAAWRHIRGRSDEPLFNMVIEDGSPEEIQEAALRVNALTASDIAPRAGTADPAAELSAAVERLDERQRAVLRHHLACERPPTLAEVGARLGISGSRAGQIERAVKDRLMGTFHLGTAVGGLLASIRVEIQPVAALERLTGLHPQLAAKIPGFDQPLWFLLDRIDDYFEVTDGWAAAPNVSAAQEHTRTLLQDFADEYGVVDAAAASKATIMSGAEFLKWLTWCGYPLLDGRVLTRTRPLGDYAAGILAAAGRPLSADEILNRTGDHRSSRSLINAMAADDRFLRTDRWTWCLRAAEAEEYTEADERIAHTSSQFPVAGAFHQRSRVGDSHKSPEDTRRLFRHGETWRLRITITRDHLRGSGFPVPAGLAVLLGCKRGDTVALESRLGNQVIRWTGRQPTSGTIKRFLDGTGVTEGRIAFLEFLPPRWFDVTLPDMPDQTEAPVQRALALVGAAEAAESRNPMEVLAEAAGLSHDSNPRQILRAYRRRGDDDVAELLERF